MTWVTRVVFLFVLAIGAVAAWDGFHYFSTLNALAEMTQQNDALEDFQYIGVSLWLSLVWGLVVSVAVATLSLSILSKMWTHVKRREPEPDDAPA